jgi:hypothetical protein
MRIPVIILLAAIGLPVAACGSSSPTSSTSTAAGAVSAKQTAMVSFSRCMRANGVPNFPDLSRGMSIQQTPGSFTVNGVHVNAPAFQSAMRTCRSKLPNGGRPPALNNSQRQAALRFSACMRTHGVPGFPDPTFTGGGVRLALPRGSGSLDPNSPAFKSAQAACGSLIEKAG